MVQPTATSITVTWDPPLDTNGIVSSYEAVLTDSFNDSVTVTTDESTTMVNFTGLMPFTKYLVNVRPFTGDDEIAGDISEISITTSIGSK